MCVVIQTTPSSALCDRHPPLIQMILPLLLLLASLLQHYGSEAESSHVSKFHLPSVKEQNGVQDSHQEKIITVSGEGMVQSPDFPNTYPRSTELVWRLVANSNMRIQLTFDEKFGLEDPEDGICKYDFVEIEDPTEKTILGRWCGSQSVPAGHTSKGSQIRIRFISDEYFPSEPGFCIRYSLLPVSESEPEVPAVPPPSQQGIEELSEAVAGLGTMEEVMKYLEPERWQVDMEELYKPTWQVLGKSFVLNKKAKGGVDLNLLREEVRLYSCTPRNFSVPLREELKRTDAIFWPSCLLVKRCGGNCACCSHRCYDCQCVPTRVTKKYHEVLLLKHRSGIRGLQKSLTDVPLEHHEECACVCKDDSD
ncbi:LOW QUALITY PROTEIN: platelet-derived growth factor C [Notolabrus celidotus]|uniref:LOW QUALITY PROTEIN: platelet-derived growth factor C n=1 Tax=Notolabrus celidotus TaxID=1203425 RepID=UPI00148FB90C|nr:LOW QUALITY PROTEIN: platelet-derived growth factor C [Notolabrus celidotus]